MVHTPLRRRSKGAGRNGVHLAAGAQQRQVGPLGGQHEVVGGRSGGEHRRPVGGAAQPLVGQRPGGVVAQDRDGHGGVLGDRLGTGGVAQLLEQREVGVDQLPLSAAVVLLCRPVGELDAYTVAQFREALTELAEESFVLVDLSDVPFMDSAGLGALIGGIRRARENNGDVAVACNRPALIRLLHTTGFDRIVPVRETVEEAVLALGETID